MENANVVYQEFVIADGDEEVLIVYSSNYFKKESLQNKFENGYVVEFRTRRYGSEKQYIGQIASNDTINIDYRTIDEAVVAGKKHFGINWNGKVSIDER